MRTQTVLCRFFHPFISTPAVAACCASLLLGACGTVRPPAPPPSEPGSSAPAPAAPSTASRPAPSLPPAGSGRGGYYLDDGPGDAPPPNLESVPDAQPKIEPYSTRGNKPYVVFGKTYVPLTDNQPMKQRGIGSWYGKKFHGQKTSSGELYDMYKMTAAHPTLPIPSYARVTNLKNGAQVIVRVNDRGPFHSSRIIDLSYTAALKLGYVGHGSTELEVERLLPDEIARINAQGRSGGQVAVAAAMRPAAPVGPASSAPLVMAKVASAHQDRQAGVAPVAAMADAPALAAGMTPAVTSAVALPVMDAARTALPTAGPPASVPAAAADTVSIDDFLKLQAVAPAQPSVAATAIVTSATATAATLPAQPLSAPASTPPPLPRTAAAVGPEMTSDAVPAPGYYLQFGAYARSANADGLRAQLLPRWPAGLPLPEVRQNGALYRLYSGPYPDREAALAAAARVNENPGARPLVVRLPAR